MDNCAIDVAYYRNELHCVKKMAEVLKVHLQSTVHLPREEENTRSIKRNFVKSSFSLAKDLQESKDASVSHSKRSSLVLKAETGLQEELDKSQEYIQSVNEILEEAGNTVEEDETIEKPSESSIEEDKEQIDGSGDHKIKDNSSENSNRLDYSRLKIQKIEEDESINEHSEGDEERKDKIIQKFKTADKQEDFNTISVGDCSPEDLYESVYDKIEQLNSGHSRMQLENSLKESKSAPIFSNSEIFNN